MELKLFGKSLFKFNASEAPLISINENIKDTKFIPDFYVNIFGGILFGRTETISSSVSELSINGVPVNPQVTQTTTQMPKEIKEKMTPKGVYELKMLNDKSFIIKTETSYVDNLIQSFKDKLSLIKSEEYDMRNGTKEISSILMRLENRKKYDKHKGFFEEFPYTTTTKIEELTREHDYLQIGQVAEFLADMPKEAVDVMKRYNKEVDSLCKKQAVFYIIADKKDFQKTNSRRDPILLAQSPFGHFWQILGAWSDEMLFIEEL